MAADVQSGAALAGWLYVEASANTRSGSCTGQTTPLLKMIHNGRITRFRFTVGEARVEFGELGEVHLGENAMGFLLRAFMLAAIAVLSSSPSVMAQERTAVRQGFELAPNSGKKILMFRPAVSVGSQSTGGMFEPNAEWTEQSKANLQNALEKLQSSLGNEIIVAPEPYGDDARDLQEHMALFAAVSQAVIEYQFFVGNRLPTKKRDNKDAVFDWSLGKTVADLPGAADADYGLFIYNKDAYGSTGRKLLQMVALFGPGLAVQSGEHAGYAALVDLKSGDLLWLNADGAMGGDVREVDGSEKRARQLLEEFPGSTLGKD